MKNHDFKPINRVLVEYATHLGVKSISRLDGLWEHDVDKNWKIKCNGHDYTINDVPPYCWMVMYRGHVAGVITAVTGTGVFYVESKILSDILESRMQNQPNIYATSM